MINPQVKIHYWKNGGGETFLQNVAWIHLSQRYCHKFLPQPGLGKRLTGPSAQEPLPRSVSYIDILPLNARLYDSRISTEFLGVFSPIWLKRGWKILESSVDSILCPRKWYTEIRTGGRFTRETCLVGGVLNEHSCGLEKPLSLRPSFSPSQSPPMRL